MNKRQEIKTMKTTSKMTKMRLAASIFFLIVFTSIIYSQKAVLINYQPKHTTSFKEALDELRILKSIKNVLEVNVNNVSISYSSLHEDAPVITIEENLLTEDWMLNSNTWCNSGISGNEIIIPAEAEDPELKIEGWMLDESYFTGRKSSFQDDFTPEEELKIEGWMLDESHFINAYNNVQEDPMKVENWMTDLSHWVPGVK